MAFSKQHKQEIVIQYEEWLRNSQAVFMLEFSNMNMIEINALRSKIHGIDDQIHVVKNTLMQIALKNVGIQYDQILEGTTIVGFAFDDPPTLAKILNNAAKSEVFTFKDSFLDGKLITTGEVKALAALPPLPVMRARLLNTILAPASQLVRTIAEPARQVAAVIQAYSEKETVPAAG